MHTFTDLRGIKTGKKPALPRCTRSSRAVCQLLHLIVQAQAHTVNSAEQSANEYDAKTARLSPFTFKLAGNVRAISLLSFMSSLYPLLLLGNIPEIAMETCPVI